MFSWWKKLLGKILFKVVKSNFWSDKSRVRLAKVLLACGADPNVQDKDGDTPLHLAIDNSNSDVVTLLLEHGADANAQNKDDETPLHKVTSDRYKKAEDKIKMVELLLDKEADPNIKNKDGKVPLERLSFFHYNEKAETKIAELLIKGGADPCVVDSDGIPFLYHAAEHGWTEMVDLLLDHKAAFNSDEEYNKQYLLNYNQSTNRDEKAFFNIIKIFFDKEVNLGLKGINILLHYAISIHYDYHDREYEKAKFELINQLIDKGANPNTKDERDATLLHYAAKKNNIKLVELLLNHKDISVDCLNKECNTPLHIASEKGYVDIVRLLLKKGASVKLPNNECNMPLHVAAEECHPEVVKLLLDSGANPNIRNGDGEVPLHKVSKFNLSLQYRNCNSEEELEKRVTRKIDTITLLFDKTNINIKNKDDKTPIELIKQNESFRDEEVIDFINNKTGPSLIQEVYSVLKEAGYNYCVNKLFKR